MQGLIDSGRSHNVFATLYHNLGIDLMSTTIKDSAGRPQYLCEMAPVKELVT